MATADPKPVALNIRVGRVFERPVSARHFSGTFDDVTAWLLGPARRIAEPIELLDEVCWRLIGAGLPLARVTLSLPTLHPQYFSTGCRWQRSTGKCTETYLSHGVLDSQAFRDSPLRPVMENGETVRRRLVGERAQIDFPILEDLRAEGLTDYIAMPLELSDGRRMLTSLATDRADGFRREDFIELTKLVPLIAPLFEIQIMRGITGNVLEAYLGRQTGKRVMAGEISRGRGETIRAFVWLCDLRNFTPLSEHLTGESVIEILNACFERVVGVVHAQGGEVLKFLGDGLLAIFPVADAAFAPDAAGRALDAALGSLAAVDGLAGHPALGTEPAPKLCVSMHFGDVIYGNIGAIDRLDFTAIGPAVNLVSRLDQLTKTVGCRLLVTGEFARVCGRTLHPLGLHSLRGMDEPHAIFTLPGTAPA